MVAEENGDEVAETVAASDIVDMRLFLPPASGNLIFWNRFDIGSAMRPSVLRFYLDLMTVKCYCGYKP
jgi:hypothetical protein